MKTSIKIHSRSMTSMVLAALVVLICTEPAAASSHNRHRSQQRQSPTAT